MTTTILVPGQSKACRDRHRMESPLDSSSRRSFHGRGWRAAQQGALKKDPSYSRAEPPICSYRDLVPQENRLWRAPGDLDPLSRMFGGVRSSSSIQGLDFGRWRYLSGKQ
jgi:hypothetical protein